ncbi:MAG: type II toxin-antitoxin system VapC family toxin [Actinomycetota bacterium]|nr:type II toxin-antitoxin system VapC family toxin [Actinomycetota bacterium]
MNAVDTSVVIAAFASWHEGHERAAEVLALGVRLPAHCALECYSVLTRLPPPHRVAGELARDFVLSRFTEPLLTVDPADHLALLDQLVTKAISGGAAYDGLVALTAARHGAHLFSRDHRAARVYEVLEVEFELIA